ncbi:FtsX-like permease family protein [Microbacterium pygmaeum]|uniref:ABC3 transporter permease C-terminal domain-containing protein n=1 Tax=Microbacterium pygmaeum TaxID=370764 RepID=A0A1G7VP92_9MICO|nr:FtsX-like permease family protein [Microbacterium pygmaeum]SDG61583.1 hypothetical protein SAMN04489810_0780 [Microbacterium pygmaeum]
MPDGRALSTASLLTARAMARRGLLASATATVAVAVATVCAVLGWLSIAVDGAADASAPGVPAAETAARVDAGVGALVSAAPALILLVGILAATAAAQLARLLAAAREQERSNARARGLSHAQAVRADAIEAAAVAATGGLTGLVVAVVLAVVGSAQDGAGTWLDAAAVALGFWWVAVVTSSALGLVLVLAAMSGIRPTRRGARAATTTLLVLAIAAAAFVTWQVRYARPTGFDPIVALAPTLVLGAGAILVLGVFSAGALAWARMAAARRGLAPAYPARQVVRRLPIYAVAVLLVGLTSAQIVFAAAYAATWTSMATDSAALRAGTDLRVDLEPQAATPGTVATTAGVAGVDAAAPALATGIEIGDGKAELIAVPTDAVATVVTSAGGIVDANELLSGLAPAAETVVAEPVALGADATGIQATATVQTTRAGGAAGLQLAAIVVDATGASAQVRLSGDAAGMDEGSSARITGSGTLPEGTAPWSLVAVTAAMQANFGSTTAVVTLEEVSAVAGSVLPVQGRAELSETAREQVLWLGDADDDSTEPRPVRAALTTELAARLGMEIGDSFEFRYAGSGRRGQVEVGAVIPAVPGAASSLALFAPLDVLQVSQLQRGATFVAGSSVWASGDPSADVALSAALEDRPVATSAPGVTDAVVGALVPGWWIATAGSVVLSLIAVFAIVQTLALARRRELGVLRALGVTRSAQARTRAAELGGVIATAVVVGAAAGVLVGVLIVPDLVRATTPGILALGTGIGIAWVPLGVALGAFVLGLAAIVGSAAVGVRRAAAASTVGEESR